LGFSSSFLLSVRLNILNQKSLEIEIPNS